MLFLESPILTLLLEIGIQAVHRNIPILIRAMGSSYSELLRIISDPPEGCENLLMLVASFFQINLKFYFKQKLSCYWNLILY